jgi:hypothetical protein
MQSYAQINYYNTVMQCYRSNKVFLGFLHETECLRKVTGCTKLDEFAMMKYERDWKYYEWCCLVSSSTVKFGDSHIFRRNISPPQKYSKQITYRISNISG